jgi:flavorubredoxin
MNREPLVSPDGSIVAPAKMTGKLPRQLSESLLWTGRCIDFEYKGKPIHSHLNAFVVKGSRKSVIVDTGAPAHWLSVRQDILGFLDGRPLDYVFPTHPEFPHGGSLPHLLEEFPQATAVGDLRDQIVYYPELRHRFRIMQAGDRLDLGDRELLFIPPLWRDLPTTLWAFDTRGRVLFVSDAFAFLHSHEAGRCDQLTSEQPPVEIELMQHFNERALFWTRFTDVERSFPDFDRLIEKLQPRLIASGHGNVVDKTRFFELAKQGMSVRAK